MTRKPIKKTKHENQLDLLDRLSKSEDARSNLKALLAISKLTQNNWRGLIATPPNSLVESVITAFYQKTDIPLEIPFFVTLHMVSAKMLQSGVTINFAGQSIKPDLWSILLASSGAGKTYATSYIEKTCGIDDNFPETSSAAKFVEELRNHNNTLWVRDEFAQLLKAMEQQTHMIELKDYLLRVYDNKQIARRTKKSEIIIDDPALTILGLTVYETFSDNVSPEAMLDGFAQRFSYVIAKPDPDRPSIEYPLYDLSDFRESIKRRWNDVVERITGETYNVTPDAEEAFKEQFKTLFKSGIELPMSFYRRVLFRCFKYATVYHVMLGKTTRDIDREDIGWAGRVCQMHLQDAATLLGNYDLPDFERILIRAEEIRDECYKKGIPFTARELTRRIKAIKRAEEARSIMGFIGS